MTMDQHMTDEQIARVCHTANYIYSIIHHTPPGLSWHDASLELRESATRGVTTVRNNPTIHPRDMHELWMADRLAHGWTYGLQLDRLHKKHPNLVPWDELSLVEKRKDALFIAIVLACIEIPTGDHMNKTIPFEDERVMLQQVGRVGARFCLNHLDPIWAAANPNTISVVKGWLEQETPTDG